MFGDMKLFCCICGKEFECTVRHTVNGFFHEACCTRPCLEEKKWREVLSIMGKEYYPQVPKEERTKPND